MCLHRSDGRHHGEAVAATATEAPLIIERLPICFPLSVVMFTVTRLMLAGVEGCGSSRIPPPDVATLEVAGVEFIAENGGGPGVRLKKRKAKR
jgi:hypothetical protein